MATKKDILRNAAGIIIKKRSGRIDHPQDLAGFEKKSLNKNTQRNPIPINKDQDVKTANRDEIIAEPRIKHKRYSKTSSLSA